MANPGTSYHRSRRHIGHDSDLQWLGEQWDAAIRLFLDTAKSEEERFITAYPGTAQGKAKAWKLSDELRGHLRRRQLTGKLSILVQKRPVLGWGVWLVMKGSESL